MIEYSTKDLQNILHNLLEKFVGCGNNLQTKKEIHKEIKDILDLIYKLESEEIKKVKRRGWTIKKTDQSEK